MDESLADLLDAVLPQTQCTRCGYEGCRPYAEAIATGVAEVNRCPPGGERGIVALARIAGRSVAPLDPSCGVHAPLALARIDEARCIGCALCIDACPVDAILGAPRRMHAVMAALCSGCELCVAPCPVDCIAMVPAQRAWTDDDAQAARARHASRAARRANGERIAERMRHSATDPAHERAARVAAAVARARERRQANRATQPQ